MPLALSEGRVGAVLLPHFETIVQVVEHADSLGIGRSKEKKKEEGQSVGRSGYCCCCCCCRAWLPSATMVNSRVEYTRSRRIGKALVQVHQGQVYGGRLHGALHHEPPLGRGPASLVKPKTGSCDKICC